MAVDAFIEVCGWPGSREDAERFLEAANNNVELAASLFFDDPSAVDDIIAGSRQQPPNTADDARIAAQLAGEIPENLARPAAGPGLARKYKYERVPYTSASVPEYTFNAPLKYPFLVLDTLLGLVKPVVAKGAELYVSRVLKRVQPVLTPQTEQLTPQTQQRTPQTQQTQSEHLKSSKELKKSLKCFVFPSMEETKYTDIISRSKAESKYVFAILYSSVHEQSLQTLLAKSEASRLKNNEKTLIWFCDVLTYEGSRLQTSLNMQSLPAAFLFAQCPKNASGTSTVTGCLLKTPFLNSASLETDVENAIARHTPVMEFVEQKYLETNADRIIRQQQDDAYAVSLAKDRERDQKRQLRRVWLERVFKTYDQYFPSTPSTPGTKNDASVECARVSLRFPEGERINARLPASAPVSDLYDIAFAVLNKDLREQLGNAAENGAEPVVNKTAGSASASTPSPNPDPETSIDASEYKFQLVSPVTRAILKCSAAPLSSEPAVYPSGVLMIDID